MMLGLSFESFTLIHVALSVVGIVTGVVAMVALAGRVWRGAWHLVFLATTAATVITGFMFPISAVTPALVVGAIASLILAIAIIAYAQRHSTSWASPAYAVSGTAALYLNLFVLVAQGFMKVPLLSRLAPTQSEPPFAVAQGLLLTVTVVVGYAALRGSRGIPVATGP